MAAATTDKAKALLRQRQRIGLNGKRSLTRQRRAKPLRHLLRVAIHQIKNEALKVACLGNIHGRTRGFVGFGAGAWAVHPGLKKLMQHVVLVGGHHQRTNRQAHHARHVPGAYIAKIATGHTKAHLLMVMLGGLKIASKVINHLSQQARPVDAVHGANGVAPFKRQIGRYRLNDVLAIVEHTLHGNVKNVGVLQAKHLRLLKRTHAAMRADHEHPNATFAAHGVFSGAAGVATGCPQDIERGATACQFVFKQLAKQLHGHVFKGQRRPVGQTQQVQVTVQRAQRRNARVAAEHLGTVGAGTQGAQIVGWDVVDVPTQNGVRQVGVA